MRTITITARSLKYQRRTSRWRVDYDVEAAESRSTCLCYDEMLRCLMHWSFGKNFPSSVFEEEEPRPTILWQMRLTQNSCGFFVAEMLGRFTDQMNEGEAVAFVTVFCTTGEEMFGGFRTYEQWAKRPYNHREPLALIGM